MENKILPQLCGKDDCMGCSSCAQSCSHGAITMMLNDEGYYNPRIDASKCVGCKLCETHCPVLHPIAKQEDEPVAYAVWTKDDNARKNSSSGGAFTAIAMGVLQEGGIVWGAGYDENVHPKYNYIVRAEDLNELRGSKYVQCEIGDTYKTIKAQLKEGKKVLFCGTPCHVAGLYAYLNGKLTENLLTIDFICHGVPSSQLFGNYIGWLQEKNHDKAVGFNFRESRFGINYNVGTSVCFKHKGKKYLYLADNSYTLGFCRDMTIHDACGTCRFNGKHRHADFTIGDYHGAKGEFSAQEQYKGISAMIANSNYAKTLMGGVTF